MRDASRSTRARGSIRKIGRADAARKQTTADDVLDAVFAALAVPARRRMMDLVQAAPGSTIASLASHFEMSAVGVLKHVRVLERAGLLLTHKHGRERLLYVNLVPIQMIHDRWTNAYASFWAEQVVDLKQRLESRGVGSQHMENKRA